MLQASTTLFKQGETFAIGFGLMTAILFIALKGTGSEDSMRTSAAGGRAALGRVLRWFTLVFAVAGFIMMLVATLQ